MSICHRLNWMRNEIETEIFMKWNVIKSSEWCKLGADLMSIVLISNFLIAIRIITSHHIVSSIRIRHESLLFASHFQSGYDNIPLAHRIYYASTIHICALHISEYIKIKLPHVRRRRSTKSRCSTSVSLSKTGSWWHFVLFAVQCVRISLSHVVW